MLAKGWYFSLLAGIVYGSVQASLFVSHLQSQDCAGTLEFFGVHTLDGPLGKHEGVSLNSTKNVIDYN